LIAVNISLQTLTEGETMTRKDYELIAKSLWLVYNPDSLASRERAAYDEGVKVTILTLADALASDNSRFDRDRFLKACGVEA
jgi:hypothetical protein